MRGVRFGAGRVVVRVALRRQRLVCPVCGYATMAREGIQDHESVWRHLDLGVWRLEIRATLRQLVVAVATYTHHGAGRPCERRDPLLRPFPSHVTCAAPAS